MFSMQILFIINFPIQSPISSVVFYTDVGSQEFNPKRLLELCQLRKRYSCEVMYWLELSINRDFTTHRFRSSICNHVLVDGPHPAMQA